MAITPDNFEEMATAIEYEIASSLDDALCEGKLAPDHYVKDNRTILREIVRAALTKANADE